MGLDLGRLAVAAASEREEAARGCGGRSRGGGQRGGGGTADGGNGWACTSRSLGLLAQTSAIVFECQSATGFETSRQQARDSERRATASS